MGRICCQAALGLQYAHEHGLVHRDIKPSNLMLHPSSQTPGGSAASVKILDLGLALLIEDRRDAAVEGELTTAGNPMGTADYIAPEQAGDAHSVDIRADLYSLGCTLYKLLTGRAPFSGPSYRTAFDKMMAHCRDPIPPIRQVRDDVPEELEAVLQRMLAKEPTARFATPGELAAAIAPLAAGADLAALLARADQQAESARVTQQPSCTTIPRHPRRSRAPIRSAWFAATRRPSRWMPKRSPIRPSLVQLDYGAYRAGRSPPDCCPFCTFSGWSFGSTTRGSRCPMAAKCAWPRTAR